MCNAGDTPARKIKIKRQSLRKIQIHLVRIKCTFKSHSLVSSIPPAETVTDDYPSPEYKWWVKELCLQETEKSTIDKGEKLSDTHMQAVGTIFSN